jgi:hypothetical protein
MGLPYYATSATAYAPRRYGATLVSIKGGVSEKPSSRQFGGVSKTPPTASLMRNGLLNAAAAGVFRGEGVIKMLKIRPKGPKSESKARSLSEAMLSEAVGSLLGNRANRDNLPLS